MFRVDDHYDHGRGRFNRWYGPNHYGYYYSRTATHHGYPASYHYDAGTNRSWTPSPFGAGCCPSHSQGGAVSGPAVASPSSKWNLARGVGAGDYAGGPSSRAWRDQTYTPGSFGAERRHLPSSYVGSRYSHRSCSAGLSDPSDGSCQADYGKKHGAATAPWCRRGGRAATLPRSATSAASLSCVEAAESEQKKLRVSESSASSVGSANARNRYVPLLRPTDPWSLGGCSVSSFDVKVREKVRSWLRDLEIELRDIGKSVRLVPPSARKLDSRANGDDVASGCAVEDGDDDNDDDDERQLPSAERMEASITAAVNDLKAECRIDERLYSVCGDLVHARIALREAPFEAWLESTELNLKPDVVQHIREERAVVGMTIGHFYEQRFRFLRRLGLQSALKYDEVYLARLENGKKESLGQFFTRLAAAAATEAMATPQFAAAVSQGCPRWSTCFCVFFWALAHQAFVPATPCMLSSGRADKASASCYLLDPRCDTADGAVEAIIEEIAPLLRARGGIGVSLQHVNGKWGVMPALKLLDSLVAATNVDCLRATGVCVYLEPWHADIISALTMRGMLASEDSRRCDNLYLGLWACDLLFKRYERYVAGDLDVVWTLFDSVNAGDLASLHGARFEEEYERLEAAGRGCSSMPIRDFMYAVVKAAVSTGSPFVLYKDAFNRHFHADTQGDALACSNLCTEIAHKTGPGESGVCNLVSVNLGRFVQRARDGSRPRFDCSGFRNAVRVATVFVNAVCASGKKPTASTALGAAKHRSIGVGIQGLHTAMLEMGYDLSDPDARDLNRRIAELLLLEVMTVSCEFCEAGLPPFDNFSESAYSRGWMHFDGWSDVRLTEPREWDALRSRVAVSGLYNSQFVALMPTAASAQVTEVSESFAPNFSNLFSKVTSTGELPKPNCQLMRDLRNAYGADEEGRKAAVRALDAAGWSVQAALGGRPECAALAKYKTAFEYDQKTLIDLCRDRAPFVDQSQSMTLFVVETAEGMLPASKVADLLMYAFRQGLKTGMYYCKIQKATNNGVFAGAGDVVCSACVV